MPLEGRIILRELVGKLEMLTVGCDRSGSRARPLPPGRDDRDLPRHSTGTAEARLPVPEMPIAEDDVDRADLAPISRQTTASQACADLMACPVAVACQVPVLNWFRCSHCCRHSVRLSVRAETRRDG